MAYGIVNVPGASYEEAIAALNAAAAAAQTAQTAQEAAETAQAAAAAAQAKAEEAVSAAESGGAGNSLTVKFDAEFAGQAWTVTGPDGESYAGVVDADKMQATMSLKKSNATYTITGETADSGAYSTEVTTGPYYGQYTVQLSVFRAYVTVTAVAGAVVEASADGVETVRATAGEDGTAVLELKRPQEFVVKASYAGCASSVATVTPAESGEQLTASVAFMTLTLAADAGSTVTAAMDGTTFSDVVGETGSVTWYLPAAGTWSCTATLGDQSAAGSVNVTEYKAYSLELAYVSSVLENNSWETIKKVAQSGKAASYWSVGDRKAVAISGTVGAQALSGTYYAFILGFNHNAAYEGSNSIDFMFAKDNAGKQIAFTDANYNNTGSSAGFRMNTSNTNSGGWNNSYMRKTICPAFKAALPAELQAAITACTKYSDNTGGGNDTASYVTATTDEVFLPAEFEVQGARTYANSAEKNKQAQYQYFKNGNSKVFYQSRSTGSTAGWWCRSVICGSSAGFCSVDTGGSAYISHAYYSLGFAPAFKIA